MHEMWIIWYLLESILLSVGLAVDFENIRKGSRPYTVSNYKICLPILAPSVKSLILVVEAMFK